MNIVLFTPIARSSAIGRVSALIIGELVAAEHVVTVVRTDVLDQAETHPIGVDCLHFTDVESVVDAGLAADVCVYQIGDNHDMHAGALRWLPHLRGIICLHDMYLGHLFEGWCHANSVDPAPIVRYWYGDDAVDALASTPGYVERAEIAPMTDWISAQAAGVITHANWVLDRVRRACSGPVVRIPLAYDSRRIAVDAVDLLSADELRLLTVGVMNANKRVDQVIAAIADSEVLRAGVRYTLAGPIKDDERGRLQTMADQRGVSLDVLGEVDDDELRHHLARSHAVAAMRLPSLEVASASALEAMFAAKPTLVTRTRFYDELPDDCVIKIDPDGEVAQIRGALEMLLADPAAGAAIGARARHYALEFHHPQAYATGLVDFATAMMRVLPLSELVHSVIRQFDTWGGAPTSTDPYTFEPLGVLWAAPTDT